MTDNSHLSFARPRSAPNVPKYMETIRQFLYDEGPHVAGDLEPLLGVSALRVLEILNLMKEEGVLANRRIGKKTYWLLAEDAEA
jgi:Mn-dependent DtxR family transcriptional regulator